MGNQSNVKLFRKQIRNVAQESFPEAMAHETVQAALKSLNEIIGAKLDAIAENVQKEVKKIDDQTQLFRNMLTRDLGSQLSNELLNVSVTMMAWQEVLKKHMNLASEETFDAEIAAKKEEILAKLRAEAEAKQAADAAERKAKADESKIGPAENPFSTVPAATDSVWNGTVGEPKSEGSGEITGSATVKSVDKEAGVVTVTTDDSSKS